jgi:hypothetical protein
VSEVLRVSSKVRWGSAGSLRLSVKSGPKGNRREKNIQETPKNKKEGKAKFPKRKKIVTPSIEVLLGIEPRSPESESDVLTITP